MGEEIVIKGKRCEKMLVLFCFFLFYFVLISIYEQCNYVDVERMHEQLLGRKIHVWLDLFSTVVLCVFSTLFFQVHTS